MSGLEETVRARLGDAENPLLLSVRSGARASMPGMMDTVLNLGLNSVTVEGLATSAGDERFAYDSYRRFVQMFGDVVLGVNRERFEDILGEYKDSRGLKEDRALGAEDWRAIVTAFKDHVRTATGAPFPEDPHRQLWAAIGAVFDSWSNPRAVTYRHLHGIPDSWGTAVTVQAMVFGNMGADFGHRRRLPPGTPRPARPSFTASSLSTPRGIGSAARSGAISRANAAPTISIEGGGRLEEPIPAPPPGMRSRWVHAPAFPPPHRPEASRQAPARQQLPRPRAGLDGRALPGGGDAGGAPIRHRAVAPIPAPAHRGCLRRAESPPTRRRRPPANTSRWAVAPVDGSRPTSTRRRRPPA